MARFTEEQVLAVADGRAHLARERDGQPIDLRMRGKKRQQFDAARANGFLTFRGSPPDNPVAWLYQLWCEAVDRPFIQLWPGRRWAAIWITGWTCSAGFAPETLRLLQAYLNEKGQRRSDTLGDRFCIGRKIPMEEAEAVAAECFRIASAPDSRLSIVPLAIPEPPSAETLSEPSTLDAYASAPGWEVYCVHCRDWHKHSLGEGHRVAHCYRESPYRGTGYILRLAGQMTPEIRRRAWANQANREGPSDGHA